ncbi:MAG: ABC transporter substrate-binding protein [Burkholderiaceae bacterium]|nr:ABC transporter substrate-binding protein [Burkholderiaceae bacterium]
MFFNMKAALVAVMMWATGQAALAAEPIRFGQCYDLTKAYGFITPQVAQAARDYAELINMKGGLGGRPIELALSDHGNEPQRGVECYERLKREGVMVFDFMSTPVARALLPRVMQDGTILIQAFHGRADAVDGEVFKSVFPLGPTYWGQAANMVSYIKRQSGANFKKTKIAYLYIDYPLGQEPIPVLQELQKREGFDLQMFPYPLPGNDVSSAMSQIRRFQPDWVIHWGIGPMNVVVVKELKRNGLPLDRFITVNWINEVDINNIGADAAKGLKRSAVVVGGGDHPLLREITRELYDKGKGAGDRKFLGEAYYNLSLAMYSTIFEGVRAAIRNEPPPLTADKIRKGLESLRDYDANGLMAPLTLTAKDHGGGGKTRIDMWDGAKWVPQTDWFADYTDLIWSTVKQHSTDFAKSGK